MRPFDYSRAADPDEAARSGALAGAAFIGGGTNLLDLMKLEIETPERLVDVSRLDLNRIDETEDGVLIGSQVSNSALAAHPLIRERYSLLSTALLSGATVQLRNKATTGGNFLQRTRCLYFYDTTRRCNKRRPGSGCDALEGINRQHAILGASEHCIATHPSDMAVAMAALDARVVTRKADGDGRELAVTDLLRLPGDRPDLDHVLEQGELITHVLLPHDPPRAQHYRKVRDRASYAFALVSVAVALDVEDGRIGNARIALGGVAHKPWRAEKAEAMIAGQTASPELFRAAAEAELAQAKGQGRNAFKIPLAKRVMAAVLAEAASGSVK